MKKSLILYGFGHVGKAFVQLLNAKQSTVREEYDLKLDIIGVIGKDKAIWDENGLDLMLLGECSRGTEGLVQYARKTGVPLCAGHEPAGDLLVDATPSDLYTGQPSLPILYSGIACGMDIVSISKGPLVVDFKGLKQAASEQGVHICFSGATAAALPALDTGNWSLAGCRILRIEGILNGTTNYILSRMQQQGSSFEETLQEARDKGIAEGNSDLDTRGLDSAAKLLLLSNSLLHTEMKLDEVKICGIEGITAAEVKQARERGEVIRLLARAVRVSEGVLLEVFPTALPRDHFLAGIGGTEKAVIFNTDTMGRVIAAGGASNPTGAAAAALKDIINLYAARR
jgi:homoserine dehydrogenase